MRTSLSSFSVCELASCQQGKCLSKQEYETKAQYCYLFSNVKKWQTHTRLVYCLCIRSQSGVPDLRVKLPNFWSHALWPTLASYLPPTKLCGQAVCVWYSFFLSSSQAVLWKRNAAPKDTQASLRAIPEGSCSSRHSSLKTAQLPGQFIS